MMHSMSKGWIHYNPLPIWKDYEYALHTNNALTASTVDTISNIYQIQQQFAYNFFRRLFFLAKLSLINVFNHGKKTVLVNHSTRVLIII